MGEIYFSLTQTSKEKSFLQWLRCRVVRKEQGKDDNWYSILGSTNYIAFNLSGKQFNLATKVPTPALIGLTKTCIGLIVSVIWER